MKETTTFCKEMSENFNSLNELIEELKYPNLYLLKRKTETSILSELMIEINRCYNLTADRRDEVTN